MNLVLISQLNYITEDIEYNLKKILSVCQQAVNNSAELLIFSNFAISGYLKKCPTPVNGLFIKCNEALETLAQRIKIPTIIGSVTEKNGKLFNSTFLLQDGRVLLLAESDLESNKVHNFIFNKKKIKLCILNTDLKVEEKNNGEFDILLFTDSRPYIKKRRHFTEDLNQYYNILDNKIVIYVNQVGGNGEHVFSGSSFIMRGKNVVLLHNWQEESKLIDIIKINRHYNLTCDNIADVYQALMLGLRDYVIKSNFGEVILGLSGGIDSALVATIACDALGSVKVRSFMLQSEYTSKESIQDAEEFANGIGISHTILSISAIFNLLQENLRDIFTGYNSDVTEENMQARIRGMIFMAISNKFGSMLLATGNKSEMSVGYATIYGDMCGGFAPIKDIYKTEVYELVKWRNNNIPQNSLCNRTDIIHQNIINKSPSAELRHNQIDQDTLPDYNVLDSILRMLLEKNKTAEWIIERGYDTEVVNYIIKLIKQSEYKRLQSPLGLNLSIV